MKKSLLILLLCMLTLSVAARKKIKAIYEYSFEMDKLSGSEKHSLENCYRYDVSGFMYQKTNYTRIDFAEAERFVTADDEGQSATIYRRRSDTIDYAFVGCLENFSQIDKNTIVAKGSITNFQKRIFPLLRYYTRVTNNIFRMESETALPVMGKESGYCDSLFNLIANCQVSVLKDSAARINLLLESDDEGNEISRKFYTYDETGLLQVDSTFNTASKLIKSTEYTYDENGKCTAVIYFDHVLKTMLLYQYRYNALGLLESVTGSDDHHIFGTEYDYEYY